MNNGKAKKDNDFWQKEVARNEKILQSIGNGVFVIDKENLISFVNQFAVKLLGWEITDLISERYEVILFGKDKDSENIPDDDSIISPIQFALIEGETTHVNAETFYCRDGSSFLVEYTCVPLLENEEIIGAVITFQDITERRDLEIAVSEARDTALEIAKEKANFLANMSHEIRTPLNGIIGISEFLGETNLSVEQQDYVGTLKISSKLLLDIVNDILDFSKIEAGKLELEESDFDLREIVAETIKLFIPEAYKRKINLEFDIQEDIDNELHTDAGRLRQILNNLIGNAIKFTENGKVSLIVSKKDVGILHFEVIDTGIGIERRKQNKIFEPFSQADISTTRQFGGTGLGLAISKQLVEMMGGKIGVESEIGMGSKFWFTIKLKENLNAAGKLSADIDLVTSVFPSDPHDLKVLVVDDNQINQEVALGRLQQLGIFAEVVNNGKEAVEICEKNEFDLILMDCRMPIMDGFQSTALLRRLKAPFKQPKIIAMTASVTADERARCLASGMDDYLTKPMTIDALEQTLNKHFSLQITPRRLDVEANFIQHPLAQIIDEKTLKSFIEIEERGEKDFTAEMLSLYLKHTETQLSELNTAFSNQDIEIVKNKVHSLRGSSGNIGLNQLFQDFINLEEVVENNWLEAAVILKEITDKFAILKTKVSYLSEFGD